MCCESTETLDLPAEVIEAVAHYRLLAERHGWDWGEEQLPDLFRLARFTQRGPLFEALGETGGDWGKAVRSIVGDDVPSGMVVVTDAADGTSTARCGPARPALRGHTVPIDVVHDLGADGVSIQTIDVDGGAPEFTVGHTVVTGAVTTAETARLHLTSTRCARWSVTDDTDGAWFPDGVLRKWDVHHRPFFHATDVTLDVPAGLLHVACARGCEFDRVETTVEVSAGESQTVECDPPRLFDPTADGWYGGDLHVHQNYSGDLVCTPEDAALMQRGEGLHLANLVVGNFLTSRIYDREMLETFAGQDLPWSTHDHVARMGVEYRNDLLGHVHALGPSAPPVRYYAGHEGSDHPDDWPPNSVACAELRDLGATVGYAHPSYTPFPDWSTDRFFATPRSVEARELVADAALGLVDSVDVMSPFDHEGAAFLYHRLLSCGLRIAATAGTDVFLSFSHGPTVASNPPGWGRVYAHLDDRPLSVSAFKDAIRAGRTVVTNGPWLTFEVDGHGPGSVLDHAVGDTLTVRATVQGKGAERLAVVGPDGVVADGAADELVLDVPVDGPLWLAAVARGPRHPNTLDESVFAHSGATYVDVGGERVTRSADARWCLGVLDSLQALVTEHGHFAADTREERLGEVIATLDQAREYYTDVMARSEEREK